MTDPKSVEEKYPCDDCGKLRTKAEGGTTFTVCDACWDKHYKTKSVEEKAEAYALEVWTDGGFAHADCEEEIAQSMIDYRAGHAEGFAAAKEKIEYLCTGNAGLLKRIRELEEEIQAAKLEGRKDIEAAKREGEIRMADGILIQLRAKQSNPLDWEFSRFSLADIQNAAFAVLEDYLESQKAKDL